MRFHNSDNTPVFCPVLGPAITFRNVLRTSHTAPVATDSTAGLFCKPTKVWTTLHLFQGLCPPSLPGSSLARHREKRKEADFAEFCGGVASPHLFEASEEVSRLWLPKRGKGQLAPGGHDPRGGASWAREPAQAQQETPRARPAGLREQCLGGTGWRQAKAARPAHLALDLGGARHRPWACGCPARPLHGPGRARAAA